MKKARFVKISEKKDQQVLDDIRMTPQERFLRMFELIELSIALSPNKKIKEFYDDRFIELKRKK